MEDIRKQLAESIEATAWKRRQLSEEYSEDARNERSAKSLDVLAGFVLSLPEDDSRLQKLKAAQARTGLDDVLLVGGEAAGRMLFRYGFDRHTPDPDTFVTLYVEEALREFEEDPPTPLLRLVTEEGDKS